MYPPPFDGTVVPEPDDLYTFVVPAATFSVTSLVVVPTWTFSVPTATFCLVYPEIYFSVVYPEIYFSVV